MTFEEIQNEILNQRKTINIQIETGNVNHGYIILNLKILTFHS